MAAGPQTVSTRALFYFPGAVKDPSWQHGLPLLFTPDTGAKGTYFHAALIPSFRALHIFVDIQPRHQTNTTGIEGGGVRTVGFIRLLHVYVNANRYLVFHNVYFLPKLPVQALVGQNVLNYIRAKLDCFGRTMDVTLVHDHDHKMHFNFPHTRSQARHLLSNTFFCGDDEEADDVEEEIIVSSRKLPRAPPLFHQPASTFATATTDAFSFDEEDDDDDYQFEEVDSVGPEAVDPMGEMEDWRKWHIFQWVDATGTVNGDFRQLQVDEGRLPKEVLEGVEKTPEEKATEMTVQELPKMDGDSGSWQQSEEAGGKTPMDSMEWGWQDGPSKLIDDESVTGPLTTATNQLLAALSSQTPFHSADFLAQCPSLTALPPVLKDYFKLLCNGLATLNNDGKEDEQHLATAEQLRQKCFHDAVPLQPCHDEEERASVAKKLAEWEQHSLASQSAKPQQEKLSSKKRKANEQLAVAVASPDAAPSLQSPQPKRQCADHSANHIWTHHMEAPRFACAYCQWTSMGNKSDVVEHVRMVHPKEAMPPDFVDRKNELQAAYSQQASIRSFGPGDGRRRRSQNSGAAADEAMTETIDNGASVALQQLPSEMVKEKIGRNSRLVAMVRDLDNYAAVLLQIAIKLKKPELKRACAGRLKANLSVAPMSAVKTLIVADQMGDVGLMEAAIDLIVQDDEQQKNKKKN